MGTAGLGEPSRCFLLSTCAICTCKPQPDPAPGRGILVGKAPPFFPSLSRAEQRASPCRCINQHSLLAASAVPDAAGAPQSRGLCSKHPGSGAKEGSRSHPPREPPRGTKQDPLVQGARARGWDRDRGCPPRHQPRSTTGHPRRAKHRLSPCLALGSPHPTAARPPLLTQAVSVYFRLL